MSTSPRAVDRDKSWCGGSSIATRTSGWGAHRSDDRPDVFRDRTRKRIRTELPPEADPVSGTLLGGCSGGWDVGRRAIPLRPGSVGNAKVFGNPVRISGARTAPIHQQRQPANADAAALFEGLF